MRTRDERFMDLALRQARKGEGRTHPNPPVGAVLVRGDEVLARGAHRKAGADHAEVDALRQVGFEPPTGSELFVTLEPCNHHGRTPPCTEAILRAGIRRVVVGTRDPHPRTAGKGIRRLRRAGVEVVVGVRAEACAELVRGFSSWALRGRPWVVLKVAATLDGRIATRTGHSRWVTGPEARREVHRLRNRLDAILVGGGTVRADNPELTCRLPRGRDPLRVVLSRSLDLSSRAKVFHAMAEGPSALVATSRRPPADRAAALRARGAELLRLPTRGGRVVLEGLLRALGERGLTTLLVEGGGQVSGGFLQAGLVDEVWWFLAPKIVGDTEAVPVLSGRGPARMDAVPRLRGATLRRLGEDWLIRGRPQAAAVVEEEEE